MSPAGKTRYNRGCFKRPGAMVWEFFYTAETGARTSMKGFASLEETLKLRQQVRDRIRQKELGVYDADHEAFTAGQATPLDDLISQFEKTKDTPKITTAHRTKLIGNVRDCVKQMDVSRVSGITRDGITAAVEEIRKSREWSYESANQMIQAMRSFCLWLHENGVAKKNPARQVRRYNEKVDRHHDRRELTDREISALLTAAMNSKRHRDGGPLERYLLCRTALETGFRKSEFRPLNKSRFVLQGAGVGIVLEAGEDKAKRGAVQPISRGLAAMLQAYFETVPDRANILRVPFKTDQMMRRLCSRAKVPYCRGNRYADFHAWRHTFISRLANSNDPVVPLPVVKELARHAHVETTMKYVHRRPDDERRAIESHGRRCAALSLALDGRVRLMLAQNGTDGNAGGPVAPAGGNEGNTLEIQGISGRGGECAGRGSNPQPSASEAEGHSHPKITKRKTYGKRKKPALQRRMRRKRRRGGKR